MVSVQWVTFFSDRCHQAEAWSRLCSQLAIYLTCNNTASVPLACPFLIDILRRHIAQVAEPCRKLPGRGRVSADLAGRDA